MKKLIFEKRQLKLREEDINIESDSVKNQSNNNKEVHVDPNSSQSGSANLANDVNVAKSKDPNAKTYVFNPSTYTDKNKSTEPTNINIKANDGIDLSNTLNKAMKSNPQVAQAVKNGVATVRANLKNESISFTKKELDNFLMNL